MSFHSKLFRLPQVVSGFFLIFFDGCVCCLGWCRFLKGTLGCFILFHVVLSGFSWLFWFQFVVD